MKQMSTFVFITLFFTISVLSQNLKRFRVEEITDFNIPLSSCPSPEYAVVCIRSKMDLKFDLKNCSNTYIVSEQRDIARDEYILCLHPTDKKITFYNLEISAEDHEPYIIKLNKITMGQKKCYRIIGDNGGFYIIRADSVKKKFAIAVQMQDVSSETVTHSMAKDFCKAPMAGYTDWRLPTYDELIAIYRDNEINKNTQFSDSWYWTSTVLSQGKDGTKTIRTFNIKIIGEESHSNLPTSKGRCRCVRSLKK